MAGKLMDSVLENSINQGLKNNLKTAIENAGVKVSARTGLWQYPEIIRNKLAANTINGINIVGGDCINISHSVENDVIKYEITTSLDSYKLNRPVWAGVNGQWGKHLSVQTLFDDLFANILPKIRGVNAGDITITDYNGNDTNTWYNELFDISGQKYELKPNSRYLRLYLTSQHEPLYIYIGSQLEAITGGYNIKNSDTVTFDINDVEKTLTAHIDVISNEQIQFIDTVK